MSYKPPIRIAIADDHPIMRSGICNILTDIGDFEIVAEGSNGRELITALHVLECLPEICIIDINMPVMDGYDTIKELKQKWPGVKTLVLSLYNNEYSIIKMLKLGVNGYISKDSGLEEIISAVRSICADGVYYSPIITRHAFKHFQSPLAELSISHDDKAFLKYCCTDLTYKEIAHKLDKSLKAVEWHRDVLFKKLQVNSRTGLAVSAIRMGIVSVS